MEDAPPAPSPLRVDIVALGGTVLGLLALAYFPSLLWLEGRWRTDPFYSHGPLIPIVSAVLLWTRRRRLGSSEGAPLAGAGILLAAALLHLLGARLRFEALSVLSLVASLVGVALTAGGKELLGSLAFPLQFLLFAIPLPILLIEQVSLPLQILSTVLARGFLSGLGCTVARHGVLLVFPSFTLAVADACSGLRSLITVLAISTLAAHLSPGRFSRKILLILVSMIAALLLNVLRIALTGLIGMVSSGETACHLFEHYSGYLLIALVVLSTLGVFRLLGERPPTSPTPVDRPGIPAVAEPLARRALRILLPIFAFTLPAAWIAHSVAGGAEPSSPSRLSGWQPALLPWEVLEVKPVATSPGEEALTGRLRDPEDLRVQWSVLHSVSGRYLHSPEACSMASGWIPERQELREDGGIPVHVWILRRGNDRECVLFWFTLDGVPRRGSLDQHAAALARRLWRGTVDSAYGEIVVPLSNGKEPEVERLVILGRRLEEAVRARIWPECRITSP